MIAGFSKLHYLVSFWLEYITLASFLIPGVIGTCELIGFVNSLFIGKYIVLYTIGLLWSTGLIFYYIYLIQCWNKYGGCPLNVLSDVGFLKFFRACRLKYKKKYSEAMVVYLAYYPCILLYIAFFIYILCL